MNLPDDLNIALISELDRMPQSALKKAAGTLSQRYRSPDRDHLSEFMSSDADRLAYLAVRMPATYAAIKRVLVEAKERMPEMLPKTFCDIGAGPGTASWAAMEVFSQISRLKLVERDASWYAFGRRLMHDSRHEQLRMAEWLQKDIEEDFEIEPHDLIVMSYVIGELSIDTIDKILKNAWKNTGQALVIIEPGTPHGFERIRRVRDWLIAHEAFLAAPCPHHDQCPMKGGDWCHFSQRLERSAMHKYIKDVTLGYEDEKFSYVIASKFPVSLPVARILRHPQHHSGHIDFLLCAKSGLEKQTLSRRHGDIYKQARKWEWGDPWIKPAITD